KGFLANAAKDKFDVTNVTYLPNTTDFRSILLKLKTLGIEGLFIDSQAEPGFIRILEQTKQLNWDVPIYGNLYPSSPTLLKAVGSKAEGIVFSDLPFLDKTVNAKGAELFKKFRAQYGEPLSSDFYFVVGVAAFNALDKAIQSGQDVK